MTTELKFCKDCKHYSPPTGLMGVLISDACNHPSNIKPNLVSGRSWPMASPSALRMSDASCGEAGLMFEAAAPPKPEWEPTPLEIVMRQGEPERPGLWNFLTGWR